MRTRWWMTGAAALLMLGCSKKEEAAPAAAPAPPEGEAAEKAKPPEDPELIQPRALFGGLTDRAEAEGRELSDARVQLGRTLYHDTRLSKNQDLSCASCHALDAHGADARPESIEKGTSMGHKGQFGDRNSPTVFHAAFGLAQFWDGRAKDVEEQAKGPILNPVEMAMPSEQAVVAVLKSIPGYAPMFKAAFPKASDAISYDNMATAIGAFERLLVTKSPFDAYLAGDKTALTDEQKAGLKLFAGKGCTACHMGPNLGGTMYQKLGLLKPYETGDTGRFKATQNEAEKFFFKVPTLRNVEKTGPYLHDGSLKTLEETVAMMAKHQTPFGELPAADVTSVVAFLKSLTGEAPAALVAVPALPESGPDTPKPDPG